MQNQSVTLRNGNTGTVVYESQFGKLLIVEHNRTATSSRLPIGTTLTAHFTRMHKARLMSLTLKRNR